MVAGCTEIAELLPALCAMIFSVPRTALGDILPPEIAGVWSPPPPWGTDGKCLGVNPTEVKQMSAESPRFGWKSVRRFTG